jgi:hypothetical protein
MDLIKDAFQKVKQDISSLQEQIFQLHEEIEEIKRTLDRQTEPLLSQTDTINRQTDRHPLEAPKSPKLAISIGNEGVQTDRQTNSQTDRQSKISHLEQVSMILDSLDEVKKELRIKFKKLTKQEMLVFSTIYLLEEKGLIVDYALLSEKLTLSESVIRDYIKNLVKKGIPLQKTKENNKKIILSIVPELKKLTNLDTLNQLRNL